MKTYAELNDAITSVIAKLDSVSKKFKEVHDGRTHRSEHRGNVLSALSAVGGALIGSALGAALVTSPVTDLDPLPTSAVVTFSVSCGVFGGMGGYALGEALTKKRVERVSKQYLTENDDFVKSFNRVYENALNIKEGIAQAAIEQNPDCTERISDEISTLNHMVTQFELRATTLHI